MNKALSALKISDSVYWVGAVDWGLADFHGYKTERGTSYNAYLVMADKITLIDTVKAPFFNDMMARISSVIDPSKIDYIVSNHAELDHSGALPQAIDAIKPEKVFASTKGVEALDQHFRWDKKIDIAGNGETLDLGNTKLKFIETRMLHWPDSMFTFLESEGMLFSNDAFGMHLASSKRFADEIDPFVLKWEACKYFANILVPFSPLINKLIKKLPSLDLDIKIIAPDHGPVWRENPGQIVELYAQWAAQKPTDKAVVLYDSMWESTAQMGKAIADGIVAGGLNVKIMPISSFHRSDIATEVLEAGALVIGSPTINGQMFPTVADVTTYLRGLKPKNLVGATFGSYGWSGEAVGQLNKIMQEMNIDLVSEGIRSKYVPDDETFKNCRDLGLSIAAKVKETLKK